MSKQRRLIFIVLILGLVSFWLLFRQYAPPPLPPAITVNRSANGLPDTVLVSAGPQYARSAFGNFFLGKHNRAIWTVPVKAKVLYLDKTFGGLKIAEVGGGMQTLSFTLLDSIGRTYALRSVDKDPISVLPPFWQKTSLGNFVRDQISGANPYGALVIPVLAQAAGIFHAHPQLRYVRPNDSLFGNYAPRAGGKLFLLEEKYQGNPQFYPGLEGATTIIPTHTLLQKVKTTNQRIDADMYLKCRLFDFLIGDWDRHTGQWMWAAYPTGSEIRYVPIPKDRDQAFCNYRDGLLPWLVTRQWALPKFGQYSAKLDDISSLIINSVHLDTLVLAKMPKEKFTKVAAELKQNLTDSVINQAVRQLPGSVQQLSGNEIRQNLKGRREQLPEAAQRFYQLLTHR
ncbi:hypothetical protein [Adhaeribacter radiodurans]|uniref:Uncharacterized protein n=1 Tax=Adhaeribacter radiodurans TaxID=2745197 RepID=A0A7L7LET1_9BACT|nr:hypothetical protein [Adhaeribacter radiodurans]QMU31293.1 hypothetical protein HUW48_26135 [Adhaeribacter radiodurans]